MTVTESVSGKLCRAEHSPPPRHSPSLGPCPARAAQQSLLCSWKNAQMLSTFLREQNPGSYISFYTKPIWLCAATRKWHAVIKEGLVLFRSVSTETVSFYMVTTVLFISLGGVSQGAWLTRSSFGFALLEVPEMFRAP